MAEELFPPARSLRELADLTGTQLYGPPDIMISQVAPLETAGAGCISFLADKRHRAQLATTAAEAVVLPPGIAYPRPHLISQNPYVDFIKLVHLFAPVSDLPAPGIHPLAWVHPDAQIHPLAAIGPFCVVKAGARIGSGTILVAQVFVGAQTLVGENSIIYPGVVLRERLCIGNRVIIHPGAIIGADGFGFLPQGEDYLKIPQIGTVVIEDDVEIGANTTIDRGALGETRIGQGSKLDNLIMVAHNVQIGPHTVIAAQAGISGSAQVGKHVTMGGQAGIAGHIKIGDHVVIGGKAGVIRPVAPGVVVSGFPARPHAEAMRQLGELARLPDMRKRLSALEAQVRKLEHNE